MSEDFAEDMRPEAEEAPVLKVRSGVMPIRHHKRYMAQGGGCRDGLDDLLREEFTDPLEGVDVAGIRACALQNGVWNDRWSALNPGMIRMNTSNRLRAMLRRGTSIVVAGTEYTPASLNVETTTLNAEMARKAEREERKAEREAAKAAREIKAEMAEEDRMIEQAETRIDEEPAEPAAKPKRQRKAK